MILVRSNNFNIIFTLRPLYVWREFSKTPKFQNSRIDPQVLRIRGHGRAEQEWIRGRDMPVCTSYPIPENCQKKNLYILSNPQTDLQIADAFRRIGQNGHP